MLSDSRSHCDSPLQLFWPQHLAPVYGFPQRAYGSFIIFLEYRIHISLPAKYFNQTSIGICFHSVAVLHTGRPCSLKHRSRRSALSRTIAALIALRPLALVQPVTFVFNSQSMASTTIKYHNKLIRSGHPQLQKFKKK